MATIGDRNRAAFEKLRIQILAPSPKPPLVIPSLDEAQLVGEVLEWLGRWTSEERAMLQDAFFKERRT